MGWWHLRLLRAQVRDVCGEKASHQPATPSKLDPEENVKAPLSKGAWASQAQPAAPALTCCVDLSKLRSLSGPLGARLANSCLALPGTPRLPRSPLGTPRPASWPLTLQEGAVAVADGRRDVHKELPSVPEHQQGQLPVRLLDQLPGIAQRQVLTGHPVDLKGTRKGRQDVSQ